MSATRPSAWLLAVLMPLACGCGRDEAARLEHELAEPRAQVARLRTANTALRDDLRRAHARIETLEAEKHKLIAERDTAQDRLTTAEKDRDNALKEIEKLADDATRYVALLSDLKKQPPDCITEIIRREAKWPEKLIRGKITAVDTKLGLAVIDRGQKHGVKVAYGFIVFRGNKYIGKLIVDEVFPDVSAAHYSRPHMKEDVKVGDGVTTKLVVDF